MKTQDDLGLTLDAVAVYLYGRPYSELGEFEQNAVELELEDRLRTTTQSHDNG